MDLRLADFLVDPTDRPLSVDVSDELSTAVVRKSGLEIRVFDPSAPDDTGAATELARGCPMFTPLAFASLATAVSTCFRMAGPFGPLHM